jgi:hypothetical protein
MVTNEVKKIRADAEQAQKVVPAKFDGVADKRRLRKLFICFVMHPAGSALGVQNFYHYDVL